MNFRKWIEGEVHTYLNDGPYCEKGVGSKLVATDKKTKVPSETKNIRKLFGKK